MCRKYTHDVWLLTEAISIEPYRRKHGSRERGEAFTSVAANLKQIPNSGFPSSLNQRGVRTRFCELIDTFKKQEAKEERASGIDAVFDEKTQLLTDIHSRMVDYEKGFVEEKHSKQEKKIKKRREQRKCELWHVKNWQKHQSDRSRILLAEKERAVSL